MNHPPGVAGCIRMFSLRGLRFACHSLGVLGSSQSPVGKFPIAIWIRFEIVALSSGDMACGCACLQLRLRNLRTRLLSPGDDQWRRTTRGFGGEQLLHPATVAFLRRISVFSLSLPLAERSLEPSGNKKKQAFFYFYCWLGFISQEFWRVQSLIGRRRLPVFRIVRMKTGMSLGIFSRFTISRAKVFNQTGFLTFSRTWGAQRMHVRPPRPVRFSTHAQSSNLRSVLVFARVSSWRAFLMICCIPQCHIFMFLVSSSTSFVAFVCVLFILS